jgi:LPPG:FO 2-phospho-L-lactate transferase
MSDDRVETHVVLAEPDGSTRAVHFQEWWVRLHAAVPAQQILALGIEQARPAPGVLDAIREADVVLLPPSNPVVSIGMILAVPGVRGALRGTRAPVVGVSPIVGGAPVRGMADACLTAIGVPTTAEAVAGLYQDFLDGWLVAPGDEPAGRPGRRGPTVVARPLLMTDLDASARIAASALELAGRLRGRALAGPGTS